LKNGFKFASIFKNDIQLLNHFEIVEEFDFSGSKPKTSVGNLLLIGCSFLVAIPTLSFSTQLKMKIKQLFLIFHLSISYIFRNMIISRLKDEGS
jgi:hypothetical protein